MYLSTPPSTSQGGLVPSEILGLYQKHVRGSASVVPRVQDAAIAVLFEPRRLNIGGVRLSIKPDQPPLDPLRRPSVVFARARVFSSRMSVFRARTGSYKGLFQLYCAATANARTIASIE